MRILGLSLVSASLLALTACGGGTEANNTSANTLGTETLPPLDNGVDLVTGTDLNTTGNTSLDVDANSSTNTSTTTNTTNTVGNSQ